VVRTGSLRTQSARRRVDHGTICGRNCANSGHYKPLRACVHRTFVNSNSSRRRPEKIWRRRLAALIDLNMLVMTGGHERTQSEYAALLAQARFRLSRVIGTGSPFHIIEVVAV
jgi:hypothetical protein